MLCDPASKEIKSRKDRWSDRQDVLHRLFEAQEDNLQKMTDTFAGSDTTAISTRSVTYSLLKNPEYKEKLAKEIDTQKRKGKLTGSITL